MLGLGGLDQSKSPDYNNKRLVGKVVDNNDPEKLHRVRIQCKEIYGDTATEDLPWAIPNLDVMIGNTAACGFFGVPINDSLVYFTLQEGDPQFPMYTGGPVVPTTLKTLMDTNYPNRYGFVDNKGNHFYVDRQTDDVEFHHMSGTQIHITPTGSVQVEIVENDTIHVVGDVTLDVDGNVTATVGGNVTADIDGNLDVQAGGTGRIQSGGALTLQGSTVTIIGSTIAHQGTVTGTSTATYTGTVIGAGKNLATHTHGGVDTGGGNTAPPN